MRAVTGILCLPVSLTVLFTSCARPAHHASVSSAPVPKPGSSVQRLGEPGSAAPDPRVGAIFRGVSQEGGNLHVCTGSVVHSTGGDLVLTAAHCLLGEIDATFVPGFAGEATTTDTFTVDEVYFDARWIASRDPRADNAIAKVSGTGSVERRAGAALSLGTAPPPGSRVGVTGYPVGVGGRPVACEGTTGLTDDGFPSLPCKGLVDGTSGAPWVSGATVVGVVGGFEGGGCTENISYSAPFDERTAQLLARAEAGGPGDSPPADYSDTC
ncbi:serine protease [Mycobacterium sp. TY815]|uniref:trypsin-like serine peptidase n=1 Tax=Mycobacterium sp. TY815 TaxID=3050581 RepID=UPI00274074E4|nr:serine protease [Mycobacterium sp. TY815]MDP7702727.1 serine protease [Mycobacterium sp. TY815]